MLDIGKSDDSKKTKIQLMAELTKLQKNCSSLEDENSELKQKIERLREGIRFSKSRRDEPTYERGHSD